MSVNRRNNGENRDRGGTVSFGNRDVAGDEKAPLVRAVFDSVAPRYDLMNDLMSGGIHRLWKRVLVDVLAPRPNARLLDVGGGTGDIAFRVRKQGGGPVIVCDVNRDMLEVGRDRALDRAQIEGIAWVAGDAECLPFPDSSMDAYATAFCLRNVTDLDAALAEARRVLRPGGRFACLEFSRVALPAIEDAYDAYSFTVLPWLGGLVAGDREAYVYLAESIRRFPPQEDFAARIAAAGLERVRYQNLSGGIAAIHSAWRL